MHVSTLGPAALVGVVLALVPVDAERAAGVQLVAARTDTLEAAVGVLAGARWWTNALRIPQTIKLHTWRRVHFVLSAGSKIGHR